MKKRFGNAAVLALGSLMGSAAFAADGSETSGLYAIGSALAIGLAALGGTFGQGKAADAALSGIARNPNSASKVFMPLIISLALIEFQAIMGFIIAFMWQGK